MKYIKRNLQIVEPEIDEEGYYVVGNGNVRIHPDIFHQQYQPLGFILTAEEVKIVQSSLLYLLNDYEANDKEIDQIFNLLTRIKLWQKENLD